MADFKRGIKAGVAVAGVYVVISAILGVIYQNNPYSIPHFIAGTGLAPLFPWTALTDPSSVISLLLPVFRYVIRGIVFGATFAALYNFLPGINSIVKGVVLSSFLWIVTVIEVIYTAPGWPWTGNGFTGGGTYYSGMIILSSVGLALAGIISALVFGALTGLLWDRFRGKELAEERKGGSVLVLSFILGLVIWVPMAVLFLIAVFITRVPVINPDMWWPDVLAMSVVFLGIPGWVLTRSAWKKTKVDKSGFRWGVAGGIMMVLTGIMLLPGLLAITGGVFSRHKLSTASSTAGIE
jgi:hypothetical protein